MNREQNGVRKIRNKVTEKTAMLYDGTPESHYAIAKWAHDGLPPEANCIVYPDIYTLRIRTLEGDHTASPGDWVIRGLKGEFYPCKPDIFEKSYEFVDSISVPDTAATPPELLGTWPADYLGRAFVEGAKWWEWHKEKATMWPSDQDIAAEEAAKRYPLLPDTAAQSTTPKCPYCHEPMVLGDGSYWCMNKKCAEQFYPSGNDELFKKRGVPDTGTLPAEGLAKTLQSLYGKCGNNECAAFTHQVNLSDCFYCHKIKTALSTYKQGKTP